MRTRCLSPSEAWGAHPHLNCQGPTPLPSGMPFCPQAVEKLVQGAESSCHSEKEKQIVLNCSRLLTRVLPYIFEDPDWRGFFWSTVPGAGRGGVCGLGRAGAGWEAVLWGQGENHVRSRPRSFKPVPGFEKCRSWGEWGQLLLQGLGFCPTGLSSPTAG